MIKTPELDEPRTRGICGPMLINPFTYPVGRGTRLTVVFRGKEVLLRVSSVVEGNDVLVGEVLEIDQTFAPLGDLKVGDEVCFSRRDVHWIDVPEEAIVDARLTRGPAVEPGGEG
jgi:hypothetical protein